MIIDLRKKTLAKRNAYMELGTILQEYGKTGDKTKAMRKLNIQQINFRRIQKQNAVNLFAAMKKELKKRR